jgi:hypothetical protein
LNPVLGNYRVHFFSKNKPQVEGEEDDGKQKNKIHKKVKESRDSSVGIETRLRAKRSEF